MSGVGFLLQMEANNVSNYLAAIVQLTLLPKVCHKNTQAPGGFEPSAFCLLGRRSNQLSYGALSLVTCDIESLITDQWTRSCILNDNKTIGFSQFRIVYSELKCACVIGKQSKPVFDMGLAVRVVSISAIYIAAGNAKDGSGLGQCVVVFGQTVLLFG